MDSSKCKISRYGAVSDDGNVFYGCGIEKPNPSTFYEVVCAYDIEDKDNGKGFGKIPLYQQDSAGAYDECSNFRISPNNKRLYVSSLKFGFRIIDAAPPLSCSIKEGVKD